jgi:hypothetical protein
MVDVGQPSRSATASASANSRVRRSTSCAVVVGQISARPLNGVSLGRNGYEIERRVRRRSTSSAVV